MPKNNFDHIAPWYDALALIVFGHEIRNAQTCFFDVIPAESKILILGGGTGWLLQQVARAHPKSEIWYVEASAVMCEKSKTKVNSRKIQVIQGTEDHIPEGVTFDIIITNFFLDMFTPSNLTIIVNKIKSRLNQNGQWIVADFVNGTTWWQVLLLRFMYRFFRLTCAIEASQLADWNTAIIDLGLVKSRSKTFYRGFIHSSVFE